MNYYYYYHSIQYTTEVQSVDNPGEVIEPVKVPQLQSHGHQQQGSRGD